MILNKGDRVGCFAYEDSEKKAVFFYGFGECIGEFIPVTGCGERTRQCLEDSTKTYAFRLDGGNEIIFGSECWWLIEEKALERIRILNDNEWTVLDWSIAEVRQVLGSVLTEMQER
jgi:hypothetical protein